MNDEPSSPLMSRLIARDILLGTTIVLAVLATIWSILSFFVPDGWWHVVINIGAFLVTARFGVDIKTQLVAFWGQPWWLAWMIAMVIWVVAVIGVRSIELAILEAIF